VTKVQYGALISNNFTSIIIPSSMVLFDDYDGNDGHANPYSGMSNLKAFSVADSNPFFASEDGVLFNKAKTELIAYPVAKSGAYSISNNVNTIGVYAFSGCTALTNLTIPNSVTTTIGTNSFKGCTNLKFLCYSGSVAHQYAVTKNIPYELISGSSCTVTFDANGGKVSPTSSSLNSGSPVGSLPTPTWAGYTFDGWYTAKSGGTKIASTTVVNANVKYYAHWTKLTDTAPTNKPNTPKDPATPAAITKTPPPTGDTKPVYKPKDSKSPVPPVAITKAPKVKSKKKAATVTIPKTAGATGYIIKYRTGKGKWKSVTVKGNNPKSKTIKKLKKGKKYTFKIQSIKKIGKKTYKAKWSKSRTVKVK
jgi:uncharacterized repeat protein (TIGR02543 family)